MVVVQRIDAAPHILPEEKAMDFVFIGLIVGFFALSAGLIRFCASLMGKGGRP
jgi:hypothetical protein